MTATIRAVAEAAGVSITTVSFVLNNKYPQIDGISKETRERVKACAAALGYRKKSTATTSTTGKTLLIGALLEPSEDETNVIHMATFDLSLLSGIQRAVCENGYLLTLGLEYPVESTDNLDKLADSGVSGIILKCPPPNMVKRAKELVDNNIPVVAVFPAEREDLYPYSVDMDNVKAGKMAAELFIKAGRKRPMFISAGSLKRIRNERVDGFCDVTRRELGVEPCGLELLDWDITPRLNEVVKAISHNMPDAIMCTDAGSAFLTSMAGERLGVSVPKDLSIIGFDCYAIRAAHQQRISSIGTSWWDAGRVATEGIIEILSNENQWTQPIVVEPRFIWGDTTPPELAESWPIPWTF